MLQTMQPSTPDVVRPSGHECGDAADAFSRSATCMKTFRRQLLPVQLDFSDDENLAELHVLRDRLMGDRPILWGLLDTAANFEDDFELIERPPCSGHGTC